MATISRAEARAFRQFTKPHKYHAQKTQMDGIWFASKREAAEYAQLALRARVGDIWNLRLQPRFELHAPSGEVLGYYLADFEYDDAAGHHVVDSKGMLTPMYRWKRKHVRAEYGIQIEER